MVDDDGEVTGGAALFRQYHHGSIPQWENPPQSTDLFKWQNVAD